MPTSPTDETATGERLLVFADGWSWRRIGATGVVAHGEADALPAGPAALAVPGTAATVHWLELPDGLAPAQAAAAARLMLADASATPLTDMHVAVGRPESRQTPVALVPAARMVEWLAEAEARGVDPVTIVPEPLLIVPPETGYLRRDHDGLADFRAPAAAFTLEPDLAEAVTGDMPVVPLDPRRFADGLPAVLAAPPVDLRQGAFARRRQWKVDTGWKRRVVALAALLVILTLAVQILAILRYTFAANRLETELATLEAPGQRRTANPGFGPVATRLFEAVRATPNLELARIEYRSDGSLNASVTMDNAATFAAFRTRAEASGLTVEGGEPTAAGGRPTAELTVRPS
ncbi:type II secretion system protein GspL [Sphingosinicella sp. LHD-64]|uniref:type II secretion system protein GspL n=1 Tax=Sphingosinicella sp. LHD-64 TaxID=3072139 RepID=UPI00280D6E5E|nr:type II secretion system protein GspL [Sphingosinicella sp. LHD-64]MDQ8755663.1 type II secretion system protein GspL [Sphingosinicella sp. LHD-64]